MSLRDAVPVVFTKLQDLNLTNYPKTEDREKSMMATWLETFERNQVKPTELKDALFLWIDRDRKGFMPAVGAILGIVDELRAQRSAVILDPVLIWEDGCWRMTSKARCLADGLKEGADFMCSEFDPVLEDLRRLPVLEDSPLSKFDIVRRDA